MIFDPADFRLTYPVFASLTDTQLENYWSLQLIYGDQIVPSFDAAQEKAIRYLIVAHLAQLGSGASNGVVGRVSSATKGTISGTFAYDDSKSGAFWNQTPYGAQIWNLLVSIAGATYYPSERALCRFRRSRRLWPLQ